MKTLRKDGRYDPQDDAVFREFADLVPSNRRDRYLVVVKGGHAQREPVVAAMAVDGSRASLMAAAEEVLDVDAVRAELSLPPLPSRTDVAERRVPKELPLEPEDLALVAGADPDKMSRRELLDTAKMLGIVARGSNKALADAIRAKV